MIASFDPSITHVGWVIFDETKSGSEAVSEAGVFKTDTSDGLLIQRLIRQRECVRLLLSSRGIKFVCLESPYFQDFNTEKLFALNQHIHEVFLNMGTFVLTISPTTRIKYTFPKMKSQDVAKFHTTLQAKKELGMEGRRFSEHVADAYFIGKLGLRFYQWHFMKTLTDSDLTEYEHHLFCGKHTFTKGIKKGLTEYTGIIYRENELFWDYSKQVRNSQVIAKEVTDGGEDFDPGRIL